MLSFAATPLGLATVSMETVARTKCLHFMWTKIIISIVKPTTHG